jgi:hypothetical protein
MCTLVYVPWQSDDNQAAEPKPLRSVSRRSKWNPLPDNEIRDYLENLVPRFPIDPEANFSIPRSTRLVVRYGQIKANSALRTSVETKLVNAVQRQSFWPSRQKADPAMRQGFSGHFNPFGAEL